MAIVLYMCFISIALVFADQDFEVTLTRTPAGDIDLGSNINLTCTFGVNRTNFQEAQFYVNGHGFFNFTEATSGSQAGIGAYAGSLSDDPAKDWLVWAVVKATFCSGTSLKQNYECKVIDKNGEIGSGTADVHIAASSKQSLAIDGQKVCVTEKEETFNSEFLGDEKMKSIKFLATGETSEVTALSLYIEDNLFEPFAKAKPVFCSKGAAVGGVYTFNDFKTYSVNYTITTADNTVVGSCTIHIVDETLTTSVPKVLPLLLESLTTAAPDNAVAAGNDTLTSSPKSGRILLYGSTIAFIITCVAVAVLGLIGVWYMYLVKEGRAAPPPLTYMKA